MPKGGSVITAWNAFVGHSFSHSKQSARMIENAMLKPPRGAVLHEYICLETVAFIPTD
jgi:hypothetical protein